MQKFLVRFLLPLVLLGILSWLSIYYTPVSNYIVRSLLLLSTFIIAAATTLSIAFYLVDVLWPAYLDFDFKFWSGRSYGDFVRFDTGGWKITGRKGPRIFYIIFICVFIFSIIAVLIWQMVTYTDRHLARYGVNVRGVISYYHNGRSGRFRTRDIQVRFQTIEGETRENNVLTSPHDYEEGDSVTIRYSRKRPSLCEIVEEK